MTNHRFSMAAAGASPDGRPIFLVGGWESSNDPLIPDQLLNCHTTNYAL